MATSGPLSGLRSARQHARMLRIAALAFTLVLAWALPPASAAPARPASPPHLSARYAPLMAKFDSLYDRVPPDSVSRFLARVEAMAPADTNLRVLLGAARALVLVKQGRWDLASPLIGPALARARAMGDARLECQLLCVTGAVKTVSGPTEEAVSDLRRALELSRVHGMRREGARARLVLADFHQFGARPDMGAAEREYRIALRDLDPALDVYARIKTRCGLGSALTIRGRYDEARVMLLSALRDIERVGDVLDESRATNALALLAQVAGDFTDAVAWELRSIRSAQRCGQTNNAAQAAANFANGLVASGRAREALALLAGVGDTTRAGLAPFTRVWYVTETGTAEEALGHLRRADVLFEHGVKLCDSLGRRPIDDLVRGRARSLARQGRVDEAVTLIDRWLADDRLEPVFSRLSEGAARTAAEIVLAAGRPQEAMRRWRDVRARCDTTAAAGCDLAARCLLGEARAARALRDPALARAQVRRALALWERARAGTRDPQLRESLESNGAGEWGAAALAFTESSPLGAEGGRRAAFDLLQRIKARTLEERASSASPSRSVTAERLQHRVLRPGELVLDVFPAGDGVLVFAITTRTLRLVTLPDAAGLHERIDRWIELVRDPSPDAASLRDAAGAAISAVLLAPVRDLVAGSTRLVVSGGGIVDDLPLALLPASPGGEPLAVRVAIASTPSLSTFARLRTAARPATTTAPLVIAGPFAPDGRRLRGVDEETSWLRGRYEGVRAFEPRTIAARRTVFAAMSSASVVHVAAHFGAAPDNPWRAGVLLGDPAREDGWLRPASLAGVKLGSRLVVLAGCASAGTFDDGLSAERGLATAFIASGAQAVVGTLWPVEDAASVEFVRRFYAAMDEGRDAASALARAQLGMKATARWNAPAAWAGFVLLGDPAARVTLPRRSARALPLMFGMPGAAR